MPFTPEKGRRMDLTGQRFGRLIVDMKSMYKHGSSTLWICVCDCGGIARTRSHSLRAGLTQSCGCLSRERTVEVHGGNTYNTTHGMTDTPEYHAWSRAKSRCRNPNDLNYRNYGGRGISFEFEDFESFYREVGPRPSAHHSIDRIDNDSGYVAGNVRWATAKEQANNRKRALA